MRKIALSLVVASFTLCSNLNAADPSLYPSSVSFMGGYTVSSEDSRLNNNHSYSFRFTQNDFG